MNRTFTDNIGLSQTGMVCTLVGKLDKGKFGELTLDEGKSNNCK